MKKIIINSILALGITLSLGACNSTHHTSSESSTIISSSKALNTSSTETSTNDLSKINEDWYASDSKYNTMPTVKKTVEKQMEELGIDDPVRAIIVNDIQNYLYRLDETVVEAPEINQNLEYTRTDTFIELRYNGTSPTQELAEQISDDLYSISGNRFSIQ